MQNGTHLVLSKHVLKNHIGSNNFIQVTWISLLKESHLTSMHQLHTVPIINLRLYYYD